MKTLSISLIAAAMSISSPLFAATDSLAGGVTAGTSSAGALAPQDGTGLNPGVDQGKLDSASEKAQDQKDQRIEKARERKDAAREKAKDRREAAREKADKRREAARDRADAAREQAPDAKAGVSTTDDGGVAANASVEPKNKKN